MSVREISAWVMVLVFGVVGAGCLVPILRAGFDAPDAPRSITLIGRPFEEQRLIEVGAALERRLAVAEKRPEMPWMQGV